VFIGPLSGGMNQSRHTLEQIIIRLHCIHFESFRTPLFTTGIGRIIRRIILLSMIVASIIKFICFYFLTNFITMVLLFLIVSPWTMLAFVRICFIVPLLNLSRWSGFLMYRRSRRLDRTHRDDRVIFLITGSIGATSFSKNAFNFVMIMEYCDQIT
jgi:hypothetical protein